MKQPYGLSFLDTTEESRGPTISLTLKKGTKQKVKQTKEKSRDYL